MTVLDDLRYTKEHMWIRLEEDNVVTIGITDYAQKEWGEILRLELPEVGDEIIKDESFGSIESANETVTDLYAPLSGVVTEINEELIDIPELVNEDPYEDGWIIRLEMLSVSELDELLAQEEYEAYISEEVIGTEDD